MAFVGDPTDLVAMYRFNRLNREVRDPRAHYGPGAIEPEGFPAELVLRDLRGAGDPDATVRILARYAALRAWLLAASADTAPELLDHARACAAAHLSAPQEDWPEGALLHALIQPDQAERAAELLLETADAAETAGHIDSALAARTAAWTATIRSLRLDRASELATGIAAFLRRCGGRLDAESWDRIAGHLAEIAPGLSPPSES
jgi:hypothetical protein